MNERAVNLRAECPLCTRMETRLTLRRGQHGMRKLLEHGGERLARWMLAPVLAVGVASVLWWRASGDLRLYIEVLAARPRAAALMILGGRG
jgi:hypothetical protein